MHLVSRPESFDIIVTTNEFGDILSDIGAGLIGSIGMAPGLCVGNNLAMAQATHGSAPDIAGKGIAMADSMRAAIYLAQDIRRNRLEHRELASNPLEITPPKREYRDNRR